MFESASPTDRSHLSPNLHFSLLVSEFRTIAYRSCSSVSGPKSQTGERLRPVVAKVASEQLSKLREELKASADAEARWD